jgi:hypothetical protein
MPLDPNPRAQNTNRRVYQDVRASLLNEEGEPGTFHLKHKGITIVADRVHRVDDSSDAYEITFGEGQGIIDGGHSYRLITDMLKKGEEIPDGQHVKVEVLTNLPPDWIPEIAGGLNTSVQVQPMSLDNLKGRFKELQGILKDEPYASKIAWKENEGGEFDARDIISLLYCFNVFEFPNNGEKQPTEAYSYKAKVLDHFEKNPAQYHRLSPILKDILKLHDTIGMHARDLYNSDGGRAGSVHFVEDRKRGVFEFPFIGERSKYRLMNGALYPMLAAFRWMVEEDPDAGNVRWKGGFGSVLRLWDELGAELMRTSVQAGNDLGRNPNALGKSSNHWSNLYTKVAMRQLLAAS